MDQTHSILHNLLGIDVGRQLDADGMGALARRQQLSLILRPLPYRLVHVVSLALPRPIEHPLRAVPLVHRLRGRCVRRVRPAVGARLGSLRRRLGTDVRGEKKNGEREDFGQKVVEEEVHRATW